MQPPPANAPIPPPVPPPALPDRAPEAPASGPRLGRVLRGLIWSGLAALVAAVALGIWGDWSHLAAAFGRFTWTAFPVALLLTVCNASLRFVKWHYYCYRIGARPSLKDSALIFIAGFALSITPGKTGEFLKAYLLSRRCDVPAWKAAPITLAERATDGFAVLILTGIGLTMLWSSPWPVVATVVASLGGCAALAALGEAAAPHREWRLPHWVRRWTDLVAHRPFVATLLDRLRQSGAGAAAIFDPRSLLLAVTLGLFSWGLESLALWNALGAFGLPLSAPLLGSALAALNAGTLIGAFSLLPGGAGAAEATIAAVLVQHMDRETAAAATLLIRICTLWFGAVLGIAALLPLRAALTPDRRQS